MSDPGSATVVDRVTKRINGWKEKLLSKYGCKGDLNQIYRQAVPTYAMMIFKIPINIYKGMADAISQFWWGDNDDK